MAKEYYAKLLRKEKIAKDTFLFALQKPHDFLFSSGQFQTTTLQMPSGKSDWRDFTIASNPGESELWIVTKITNTASLFKKTLLHVPIGSQILLEGAKGGFTLDKNEKRQHVFLAGGIGVTVFRSMLTAKENKNLDALLIASFSSKTEAIFQKELEMLGEKIIYHESGKKGRLSKEALQKYIPKIKEEIFLIAGGQDFVDAISAMLLQLQVPQENIRIDYFTGY